MQKIRKFIIAYWPLLIILLAASVIFITPLGRDMLQDWDECLYAVNAREMKANGNFLVNFWNGRPDFQKPPLYTWILTAFYSFGINEFTTRIFNVIALFGLLTSVYIFTKKYFSTICAVLAALLLLTSQIMLSSSNHASTDVSYTLFIFLGFWSFIASFKNSRFSYLSGLFFGLSVMIKGISTLPYLGALFLTLFINLKKERVVNFFRLLVVFTAIALPWHIVTYQKYGFEFFRVYFLENIVKRSQFPLEFHRERWYFYFVLLVKEFFPWILFTAVLPFHYLKNAKSFLSLKKIQMELKNKEIVFTIVFLAIVSLLAITRIQTRIAWYALPLYPFFAIYLAYNIEFLHKKIRSLRILHLIITLLTIHALVTLLVESRLFSAEKRILQRDEAIFAARNLPHRELHYLVPKPERDAREILPPEEQIPQTWTFGGHPCAVFYSEKRVHFYYFTDDFARDLQTKKSLFMIPNPDIKVIRDVPIKILFKNSQFTIFEK